MRWERRERVAVGLGETGWTGSWGGMCLLGTLGTLCLIWQVCLLWSLCPASNHCVYMACCASPKPMPHVHPDSMSGLCTVCDSKTALLEIIHYYMYLGLLCSVCSALRPCCRACIMLAYAGQRAPLWALITASVR